MSKNRRLLLLITAILTLATFAAGCSAGTGSGSTATASASGTTASATVESTSTTSASASESESESTASASAEDTAQDSEPQADAVKTADAADFIGRWVFSNEDDTYTIEITEDGKWSKFSDGNPLRDYGSYETTTDGMNLISDDSGAIMSLRVASDGIDLTEDGVCVKLHPEQATAPVLDQTLLGEWYNTTENADNGTVTKYKFELREDGTWMLSVVTDGDTPTDDASPNGKYTPLEDGTLNLTYNNGDYAGNVALIDGELNVQDETLTTRVFTRN